MSCSPDMNPHPSPNDIPIIDVQPLVSADGAANAELSALEEAQHSVARQIRYACREYGFFYIVGHGVSEPLQHQLEQLSRRFFALRLAEKQQIQMALGGKAWRGYFAVGKELTSGKPDLKEGLYFGAELGSDHPAVQAHLPMHGANLFPSQIPELRETVLSYMTAMTELGHALMVGIALSLGLEPGYFRDRFTADPFILFRIFHYPAFHTFAHSPHHHELWGVGEHTDYGLLTILKQDDCGGLQIKCQNQWIEAPPVPNSFVCNIGDMLERMTQGFYQSTPHRVKNISGRDRLSFPFFFDPNFCAEVHPILIDASAQNLNISHGRWDRASVHTVSGTYGNYILKKVFKVFPDLTKTTSLPGELNG
ncbi:isopenicillin N synthase family dioxygenase [Leptolyngbya sp. AN02str]|uniref:isopenicillin N synthase family dioxygenase n=1 Tax=Leptolyngbya sp. AN02str TaxID=3423363 RepID=UPI003D319FB2